MDLVTHIELIIQEAIPDAKVYVKNPYDDGEHFEAIVVSPSFEGMSLVKQHKLVMTPLKDAFSTSVHALALKTMTPQQWEARFL